MKLLERPKSTEFYELEIDIITRYSEVRTPIFQ